MIAIEDADDFEMFSSNSAGAMQGLGYQCRDDGRVFNKLFMDMALLICLGAAPGLSELSVRRTGPFMILFLLIVSAIDSLA